MKFSTLLLAMTCCVLLGNVSAQEQEPPVLNTNPSGYSLDWTGTNERTYFIQWSTTLTSWEFFPTIRSGDGSAISHGFNSTAPKFFLRLKWTDADDGGDPNTADFDGDGWGSLFELQTLQTDPLKRDTSGDGQLDGSESNDGDPFPDAWEIEHFGDLTTLTAADADGDLDGDGISNGFEAQMRTDPNSDQSGTSSTREQYTYTTTGKLDTVSGDKPMSFVFDDEGNLTSAQ